jgi:hypothetical protein
MQETFERVEKHLYRRQYQTSSGDWTTLYCAIFVDWKGKRRKFPLGSHLDRARNEIREYRLNNNTELDFDKNKYDRELKKITFSEWTAACGQSRYATNDTLSTVRLFR